MRSCIVLVNGIEAGILTEDDTIGVYSFKYLEEYISTGLPPVSLTMPVKEEEYQSTILFPYFFNLLSEGANRELQASLHHIDKDDDFGILLATAQYDTSGVVTVKPITQ